MVTVVVLLHVHYMKNDIICHINVDVTTLWHPLCCSCSSCSVGFNFSFKDVLACFIDIVDSVLMCVKWSVMRSVLGDQLLRTNC